MRKIDNSNIKSHTKTLADTVYIDIGDFKPAMTLHKPNDFSDKEFIEIIEIGLNDLINSTAARRNNIPISCRTSKNGFLDNVRFSVRKSFYEKNPNKKELEYIDLNYAKERCPVGYRVYDVLTGQIVYSNCDYNYENMWTELKRNIYIMNEEGEHVSCKTIINIIDSIENEARYNE